MAFFDHGEVKRTATLVAVGVLAGAAVTFVMTGLEPGTKADWVAAAGTWVIGIAACALTYLQVRSALTARDSGEVRQLRVMAVRAASLCIVANRFIEIKGNVTLRSTSLRIVIGALEKRCSEMHLDIALVDTDDEFEVAVSNFDYRVMTVQSICKSILDIDDGRKGAKIAEVSEGKWLIKQIENLLRSQKRLQTEIARKLDEIKRRGMVLLK